MLRGEVLDVGQDNVVYVKIPQKYGNDSVKAVTRISVSKGDLVYVTDTSVSRVPQWVVFEQMNAVGSWGSPYPHVHPMGQVAGLVSKLGDFAANITSLFDRTKNAKDYGAKGDGVTNDAPALQAALNASAGKSLFIPAGRYIVDTKTFLTVPARTTVYGENGTVLVAGPDGVENFLRATGSYMSSRQTELATAVNAGDSVLDTKTGHPYKQGDVLRLVSQRISTSNDAGQARLGWATIGGQGPYFSEYVRVQDVLSPTRVQLDRALVFDGYRPDKTQETDEFAASSSVLMGTNSNADEIKIRDLTLEGKCSIAIRLVRSNYSRVDRVTVKLPSRGRGVAFEDCYRTEAKDCHVYGAEVLYTADDHALSNMFHISACQSSGFVDCTTTWGAQCYDLTYRSSTPYPSVFCYVRDCSSFGALYNPMTLHPGTYACAVTGCNFTENRQSGISVRGNASIIANNQVVGSNKGEKRTDNAGIYMLEGGGKQSLITGNTVQGFNVGMRINDGGNKPFEAWIGASITNNVFLDFFVGMVRTRMSGQSNVNNSQGIIAKANTFSTRRAGAIGIITCEDGLGVNGWSITANDFRLPQANSVGILVLGPSGEMTVHANTFHEVGTMLTWDAKGATTGSPATVVHWAANAGLTVGNDRFPPPSKTFQVNCTDGTIQTYTGSDYTLDSMLWNSRSKAASVAGATVARGWPLEGFEGYVESVRHSSTIIMQTGYGLDGRRHYRARSTTGAWSAWIVI